MKNKKYLYLLLIIIPIIVIFIGRSFSLEQEVKSVTIESNDYDDAGSYRIEKSAEWIGSGKARVTFDVNSIVKTSEGRYKDVILVIDVSASMNGTKINKAKADAVELAEYLLSDSHNRMALITFSTSAALVSGLTNNRNDIVGYINNISLYGNTNYNDGLKKVDNALNGYVREENKDLIVLFLTDGYPNNDTPNEKATYNLLKEKYPYITINGIQYEMGNHIIREIINISDHQWIASEETLNNVLFEAVVSPIKYETFVVEDYINGDYFYINSLNDIEVSCGNVTLGVENGLQKVTWDLGNDFRTGQKAQMYIDISLKNEYHGTKGFYPTNNHETIMSKLPDEEGQIVNSTLTPILKNKYEVVYDANTPSGCTLPAIDLEEHFVYQNVTIRQDSLSCEGYTFKGWRVDGVDLIGTTIVNDNTFVMPDHNVTIRGTWAQHGISKAMDGSVQEKLDGTLMRHNSYNTSTFGKSINRSNFESITTTNDVEIPMNAIDSWDVSDEQNESVIAWYTDVDNNGKYELYIGQDGGVKANPNSSNVFSKFENVSIINLNHFITTGVTNISNMFANTGSNVTTFTITNLGDIDTSSVTNMGDVFRYTASNSTTINIGDLSGWDTSNVTDMNEMFAYFGQNATTFNVGDLGEWDTSKVTDMLAMFCFAGKNSTEWYIGDIGSWDVSKVKKMGQMFTQAGMSTSEWSIGDLSGWNPSSATDMSLMFFSAGRNSTEWYIGDIGGWDVSSATNMSSMFIYAGYSAQTFDLGDLSEWNISNVTTLSSMFSYAGYNSQSFNLQGLSGWDVSHVTNLSSMFKYAGYNATTWNVGDLSGWTTTNVTNMSNMFSYAGYSAQSFNVGNIGTWTTTSVTNMSYMFEYAGYNAQTFNVGNLGGWTTTNVTDMSYMFEYAGYSAQTFNIGDLSSWANTKVTNMSYMFQYAGYSATTWNSIGTLKVYATRVQFMFNECKNANATLNLYKNPSSSYYYDSTFTNASTVSGSGITVNYSRVTTNIDNIIATKSTDSNVVKGVQLD